MNVLVIAPHPDDESIGCGGALCLHQNRGDLVTVVYLTSGELGLKHLPREQARAIREAEARAATAILGIERIHFLRGADWSQKEETAKTAETLKPILDKERPGMVYVPHPREWHPDHQAALPIVTQALQNQTAGSKFWGYEIWTPLTEFTRVEDISAVMSRKLKAVRAHRSQLEQFAYDRAIAGLNRYRGVMAGQCRYAEVFQELMIGSADILN